MPPAPSPFSRQVVIEYGHRVGTHYVVGSARRAAECLIEGWPTEGRGPAYTAAIKACLTAIEGAGDVEVARQAFIAAAKEVGIFVREGDGRR